ncbi:MAG: ABC transporter permease, partial [Blastocatellia bacterium]
VERAVVQEPVILGNERRDSIAAGLLQDLRYAVRTFARRPGFAAAAIITLALGIGANTAMFSVVDSVLLRSLPYKDAGRLAMVFETEPELPHAPVSTSDYLDWKDTNQAFESVSAGTVDTSNLTGTGEAKRVQIFPVSAGFFATLGVPPALGREFRDEENTNKSKVVVLTDALWRSRFGSDPAIIGRNITLSGEPYEVVGVMPSDLKFPAIWGLKPDMWTPLDLGKQTLSRGNHSLYVIGRLKPGNSLTRAQAEMESIAGRLATQFPDTNAKIGARVMPLRELLVGDARQPLLILFAAVGFVLLIACANIANVLLTQSVTRQREMAIRTALGASGLRLIRQVLAESILLGLGGGCGGLLLAMFATPAIVALSPDGFLPQSAGASLNLEVLLFALGVSLLTGSLFGLVPALRASRTDLNQALKEGMRTMVGSARSARVRNLLVVAEVALALVLLTGAGLMVRSFQKLTAVDPGFDPKQVLTMGIDLPDATYPTIKKVTTFFDNVISDIDGLPGVEMAGAASQLPLNGGPNGQIQVEGRPATPGFAGPLVQPTSVTVDYFRVMRIGNIEGRTFVKTDTMNSPDVVVINETLAQTFWPGEHPLGKRLSWGVSDKPEWREVVGVVRDTHESGMARKSMPELFFPYAQAPNPSMSLVVRSGLETSALLKAVREQIEQVDKSLPVYAVQPMTEKVAQSIGVTRYQAFLMGLLGLLALVLASVGIYSVVSYGVSQRTHEIGVRKSLGARTGDVLTLIVGSGMAFVLVGLAIGSVCALLLTRLMSSLLFGVTAMDPVTLVVVPVLLGSVALMACFIPAWRATRIEPAMALRYE